MISTFDQRQSPRGLLWAPSYRFAAKAAKPKHMLDPVFFITDLVYVKKPIGMINKKVGKVG